MVRGEDYDGIVSQPGLVKDIHDLTDLVVDVGDHAVVSMTGHAAMFIGNGKFIARLTVMQVTAKMIHLVQFQRRDAGAFDVIVIVAIPILLPNHKGRMWTGK